MKNTVFIHVKRVKNEHLKYIIRFYYVKKFRQVLQRRVHHRHLGRIVRCLVELPLLNMLWPVGKSNHLSKDIKMRQLDQVTLSLLKSDAT